MNEPKGALGRLARLYTGLEDRLYYELAAAYDAVSWLVSLGQWSRWRRLALEHLHGTRVLEVGFGTGELLIELARRGRQVFGLELSPAMHRITAGKLARQGIWVSRVRGVAQATPFADGAFDTLIATFPADFIFDPATLREAARLLTTGGRFIIVDMCLFTGNDHLRRLARAFGILTESDLARYEPLAAEAGLRVRVIVRAGKGLRVPVIIAERSTGSRLPAVGLKPIEALCYE
jgi:SAM-dependent methyltransferase